MSISQAKQLKITATNIRSILVERSKTVNKLKLRKATLQRRKTLQAERLVAEKKVESKGKGPMRSVLGNVKGMVMPIGSRIMNFFGSLIMGWVVTKLPIIIEKLKSAWDVAKPILDGAWQTLKIAFKAIKFILHPLLKDFGGQKKDKVKKKVEGEEQEFTETKVEKGELISGDDPETDDLEEPGNEAAEISSPETDTPDLEPTDESDTGGSDSSGASSSPLSGVSPQGLVNGGGGKEEGGGSEGKKRSLPLTSASTAISKMRKVSQNLKGNGNKKNVKTVIVPVEVSASTSGGTGSNGGTLQTPAPVMSGNNLENQRLP